MYRYSIYIIYVNILHVEFILFDNEALASYKLLIVCTYTQKDTKQRMILGKRNEI